MRISGAAAIDGPAKPVNATSRRFRIRCVTAALSTSDACGSAVARPGRRLQAHAARRPSLAASDGEWHAEGTRNPCAPADAERLPDEIDTAVPPLIWAASGEPAPHESGPCRCRLDRRTGHLTMGLAAARYTGECGDTGEVTERPIVQHWKCCVRASGPRVRIPPSPLRHVQPCSDSHCHKSRIHKDLRRSVSRRHDSQRRELTGSAVRVAAYMQLATGGICCTDGGFRCRRGQVGQRRGLVVDADVDVLHRHLDVGVASQLHRLSRTRAAA